MASRRKAIKTIESGLEKLKRAGYNVDGKPEPEPNPGGNFTRKFRQLMSNIQGKKKKKRKTSLPKHSKHDRPFVKEWLEKSK